MEHSLSNQVAIVTGAASGIGKAIVQRYLEAGAAGVIGVDLPSGWARAGQSSSVPKNQDRFVQIAGDVCEESTAIAFTKAAMDRFGRIDVLVNNAAIGVVKALHEHSPQEWDAVMNTNVKSVYWAARHVIPVMISQHRGLILNTGSISGQAGIPTQGAYAASKGAIHQMTRQMAIEYAPHNIRVNAVCCGTVDTPLVHHSAQASGDPDAYWAMLRQGHPIGRVASAEEVAEFFLYLATDQATFFTGALLFMDGGYTAR